MIENLIITNQEDNILDMTGKSVTEAHLQYHLIDLKLSRGEKMQAIIFPRESVITTYYNLILRIGKGKAAEMTLDIEEMTHQLKSNPVINLKSTYIIIHQIVIVGGKLHSKNDIITTIIISIIVTTTITMIQAYGEKKPLNEGSLNRHHEEE